MAKPVSERSVEGIVKALRDRAKDLRSQDSGRAAEALESFADDLVEGRLNLEIHEEHDPGSPDYVAPASLELAQRGFKRKNRHAKSSSLKDFSEMLRQGREAMPSSTPEQMLDQARRSLAGEQRCASSLDSKWEARIDHLSGRLVAKNGLPCEVSDQARIALQEFKAVGLPVSGVELSAEGGIEIYSVRGELTVSAEFYEQGGFAVVAKDLSSEGAFWDDESNTLANALKKASDFARRRDLDKKLKEQTRLFLEKNPELRDFIQTLEWQMPVAIFGGFLRDLAVSGIPEAASDVDLVVDCPHEDLLAELLVKFPHQRTQFGGYRLSLGGIPVDIWPLYRTWAIRKGHVKLEGFGSLLSTTFFSSDTVVFDLTRNRVHSADGFYAWVFDRFLDVNLEENPSQRGPVERVERFLAKFPDLKMGSRLVSYLSKHKDGEV